MQEVGETAHQAGIREVFEETGLKIEIAGLIDVVDLILRDDADRVRTHYTLIDFYGHCVQDVGVQDGGEPRPGDDADEVRWVSFSALDDYGLWPQTRRVINVSGELRNCGSASA